MFAGDEELWWDEEEVLEFYSAVRLECPQRLCSKILTPYDSKTKNSEDTAREKNKQYYWTYVRIDE